MSFSKLEEVVCPCGERFEVDIWNAINATEDPDLKEALISSEINIVCCPECHQMFYAEHFVLYQDSSSELLAFVYPSIFVSQSEQCEAKMKEDFKKAIEGFDSEHRIKYQPVMLFGLDSLVTLIHYEEELNDEVQILKHMAKDLGVTLMKLNPSKARLNILPSVLPRLSIKKAGIREEIMAGIKVLIKHNEHLTNFKNLLVLIEGNKDWVLDTELLEDKNTK